MSKPALRPVDPSTLTSVEMAEAIEALMRECIAAQPVAVMVAWELPSSKNRPGVTVSYRSVPESAVLRLGMVDFLYDLHHPENASD